jgi:amino acid adenylation domain-containing protein
MISITDLLAELAALDIQLRVEKGALHFNAPEGVFHDEIRKKVLAVKPDLIAFLQRESSAAVIDEAPLTDTECRLAALWREFLKCDKIGAKDDFFILGGHSLLLMRLVLRIESAGLGKIDLSQAISARTLEKMAGVLDKAASASTALEVCESSPSELPLSSTQPVISPLTGISEPYLLNTSIARLWQRAAKLYRELPAIVYRNEIFTYQELDGWSSTLAAALFASGVKEGSTVALATRRSAASIAAIIAILKCGAVYLPLDDKMPHMLTEELLRLCDAHWIIIDQEERDRYSKLKEIQLLELNKLNTISSDLIPPEIPEQCGHKPAYIMFTSGSTGEPKGVIIPHRAVARLALSKKVIALQPGDGMAQTAPLAFDASTLEIWATLLSGARLVFIEESLLLQPEKLGNFLAEKGVTAMWLTASLVNRIADLSAQAFAHLRVLLTGGEVLSPHHLKTVMRACPDLQIFNGYGPTENTTFTTLHAVTAADLETDSVPIGRPIDNTQVYVLDEALLPADIGVIGELYAGGDGLAIGYAGRKDLTDHAFLTLPDQPEKRIYRTGDLARWRIDGILEFCGRKDGQIKLRGHRIETSAIETVLSDCHGVKETVVMVDGEGESRELVAFVTARHNDEMLLRHYLAERLPIYMMPARFIWLDEFKVNSNGKKDRTHLSKMLIGNREEIPLSFGQERLWILQHLTPDIPLYNVPLAFAIEGELDCAAITRAIFALEKRHKALRSLIRPADDTNPNVRHQLLPPGGLVSHIIDLSSSQDPEEASMRAMAAETVHPFRLESEIPARIFLFRLSGHQWRFFMVIHHIACDGWSLDILLHDFAALYAIECGVPDRQLSPLRYGFTDYVDIQKSFLKSEHGQQVLDRRCKRLTPPPEPLDFPTDHIRPLNRSYAGHSLHFPFEPSLSQRIDQLAQDAAVTPYVLLLAIVELLLYRISGHGRNGNFAVGALTSGRESPEMSDLIGFFVNTVVIPCHIKPEQTFIEHLASVSEEWQAALSDQQCPFAQLVDRMNMPRNLSRNPLFDVLVVWQDLLPEPPDLPGLKTRSVKTSLPFAKFDLSFNFVKNEKNIELFLEFSTELFEEETIGRMVQRLQSLLSALVHNPLETVAELDIWIPGEKHQVIEEFNNTTLSLPTRRAITEPFLDASILHATLPAVLCQDGAVQNYRYFARQAGAIAALLIKNGVQRGEHVVLLLPRSSEMLSAIFGILMAGAVYIPLDPTHPPLRLCETLKDLQQPFVLCEQSLPEQLALCCRPITLPDTDQEAEPVSLASPDDLAYIIFTSGSTGKPKGVMIEHHAVLNRILWMQERFPIGQGDVVLQKTPVTFDVSIWELFWWSWTGAAVAMLKPGDEKNPEALADAIEQHQVTIIHFVPSMLAVFLDKIENGRVDCGRIASLRLVFVSGEALDATVVERFNRLIFDRHGTELHNLYGPTEATVDVSWQPVSPWPTKTAPSIGRPIANTLMYILDEHHRPLPAGISGEIAISGVQVARGYLNQPELTAERFIADPFNPKLRMYVTGDLGRWTNDGRIEYLGRSDWQVKIRGQRIEPGEIEQTLEHHCKISRAVVVPVENQGLTELHAWVQSKVTPDIAAIRNLLREHLPESMIPARFFPIKELPQTENGKLDRQQLAKQSQAILAAPSDRRSGKGGHKQVALTSSFTLDEATESLKITLCFNPEMISVYDSNALARRYFAILHEIVNQASDTEAP